MTQDSGQLELPFTSNLPEAEAGRQYLRRTGAELTPDAVKEALGLRTSAATLGRKFRASAEGDNPKLLKGEYTTDSGRVVRTYRWNYNYNDKR